MKISQLRLIISLLFSALFIALPGRAQAHGEPVISVQPPTAAAGSQITIIGTEMEPGEVFTISLESVSGAIPLGEATAVGEGEKGGFEATFAIPAEVAPGSYTIRAATEEGEETVADLTITLPSAGSESGPATILEPSGEEHVLERARPTGQLVGVLVVALASVGLGWWLVRWRA